MNRKMQKMAVLIEFLVSSGLAILFHRILHYQEAAYTIFGIGILLSLVTYLLGEEIEKTRERLLVQYNHAHEITFAIARINDAECRAKALELLASAKRTIILLQQGYIPLDETEFYLEGAKCSDRATRRIKAVDPLTEGWGSRGALLNYYQANLRALDRGVKVNRIFVINSGDLTELHVQKVLLAQYRDNVEVRIAFRNELPSANDISGRDTSSSFDFAIYDDRLVSDVFGQPGKYFGRKTSEPCEVCKYLSLYDLIEHSSCALAMENDRIVLADESIGIARQHRACS